jgi:hypothetical protein
VPGGIAQIVAFGIGSDSALGVTASVPRANQNGAASGITPGLDIHCAVANHKRRAQVEIEVDCGAAKHACTRLAIRTEGAVFRQTRVLVMGAEIDAIYVRALFLQQPPQAIVNLIEVFFGAKPARNHWLIRDHQDLEARLIQEANAISRHREKLHLFDAAKQIHFLIDDAVPIQKYPGVLHWEFPS